MPNAKLALTIGLAGCASALAMPSDTAPAPTALTAERSPAQLEQLLTRYDRIHDGAARDALALEIDKVAAQRYATTSRLFWYTDLAQAEAAAALQGKPILALRMLGRLDEDLSCANSRLFRATLYANREVATYMKSNFILYWSSERPVPRVTIDFGDGRKLETTTTGNSAHYILDAKGEILDVLPGLYAPHAFRSELARSLSHARDVAAAPAHERGARIIGYHKQRRDDGNALAANLNVYTLGGKRVPADDALLSRAQRAAISKAYVEVPQLRKINPGELAAISDDESLTWTLFAEKVWPKLLATPVFDEQSLALIKRLAPRTVDESERMVARLTQHVLADSALNELRLRPAIHEFLARGSTDFTTINTFVYSTVFHTPASDPWLGLLPRTDFTGVPDDGVTAPVSPVQP